MNKVIGIVYGSTEIGNIHAAFRKCFDKFVGLKICDFFFPNQLDNNMRRIKNSEIVRFVKNNSITHLIMINGWGFYPETLQKMTNIKKIIWNIDDPYSFKNELFAPVNRSVDSIYTTCDKRYWGFYNDIIKKEPKVFRFGFCEEFNFPSQTKDWDVCFIGTPYNNRIKYLERLYDMRNIRKVIAGANKPYYTIRNRIGHDKTADIMRRSKICLNFCDQPDGILSAKNRIPEIMGSGSMLLTQDFPERYEYIWNGNGVIFGDPIDMTGKIKYYLNNDEEREKIANRAYIQALEDHRYEYQIYKMLEGEGII